MDNPRVFLRNRALAQRETGVGEPAAESFREADPLADPAGIGQRPVNDPIGGGATVGPFVGVDPPVQIEPGSGQFRWICSYRSVRVDSSPARSANRAESWAAAIAANASRAADITAGSPPPPSANSNIRPS